MVLAVGNRLSIRQVGYNWQTWAREAEVIMVDIDPAELKKTTLHVEVPICGDAKDFFSQINERLEKEVAPLFSGEEWIEVCRRWKEVYPVTQPKHWEEDGKYANVYAFVNYLSNQLKEKSLTVVSNGSACVVGSHNYEIKKDARFLIEQCDCKYGIRSSGSYRCLYCSRS